MGSATSSTNDIIQQAHDLATSHVGTEHLLLAIVSDPGNLEFLPGFPVQEVKEEIQKLPWVKSPGPQAKIKTRSEAFKTAITYAKSAAEADGEDLGLWHLCLGLLFANQGIARYILLDFQPKFLHVLLSAAGKSEAFLKKLPPREQHKKNFYVFNVGGPPPVQTDDDADAHQLADPADECKSAGKKHADPESKKQERRKVLPTPSAAWCRGPTAEANWLIPGRVMTGQVPGGWAGGKASQIEVDAILAAGATTFVSLLEVEPEYRHQVEISKQRSERGIDFVWFPIDDFSTAPTARLEALTAELARRVARGEVLYIHCFSGRGRTGTIAIPLVLALYPNETVARVTGFVNDAKMRGRSGRTRGGHMPEVEEQVTQVAEGEVRWKRGGHRAKTSSK